jgi:hypothetical protein
LESDLSDAEKKSIFREALEDYKGKVDNMADDLSDTKIDTMIKNYNQV